MQEEERKGALVQFEPTFDSNMTADFPNSEAAIETRQLPCPGFIMVWAFHSASPHKLCTGVQLR